MDGGGVVAREGNVLDTISVMLVVLAHLAVVGLEGGLEDIADFSIADDVRDDVSVSSLEALVGDVFESHSGGVVRGSLLGVSNPELNVIEAVKHSNSGTHSRLGVIGAC